MAFLKVKNRAVSLLASGVSDTDTSWTLATAEGAKFPDSGNFHVTCEDEIVMCTARSGDVLTAVRAQEGTSAAAHSAGKAVELRVTAGIIENIQNEVIPKSLLTTQGDLIIRGASAPERLAKGTERYFLRMGANEPEWVLGYEFGKAINAWQWEIAFYDLTTTVSGSGEIYEQGYGTFYIKTNTTSGSTARGIGYSFGWFTFGSSHWFEWYIYVTHRGSTTNGRTWIKIDIDTAADPTDEAFGFRLDGDALKGIVHNGTSLTVVDLNTTFNSGSSYQLFIKIVPGDKIYWYVNGIEKGNSSNIPSAARSEFVYPVFAVSNETDSANQGLQVRRHGWITDKS